MSDLNPSGAQTVTVAELNKLVEEIFVLQEQADAAKEALAQQNIALARKEQKAIEYVRELGLKNFRGSRGLITPVQTEAFKTPETPELKEEFYNFLKAQNLFDGMASINYQTLNSWAKKEVDAAKERGDMFYTIPGLGAPTIAFRLQKTKAKGVQS